MAKTKIEWATDVWNPTTGCTKVSQGCKNCYAERMAKRLAGRAGYPDAPNQFDVVMHLERLALPARWRKPRRVFVDSMSDLFHDDVDDKFIGKVFWTMGKNPLHTFLILTKRPRRMCEMLNHWLIIHEHGDKREWVYPLPNVWLGVSVEDQETVDERIPLLLKTPAAVRFVSYEPALGPVKIIGFGSPTWGKIGFGPDWVICGGESGPGARPMHPDWARGVRDQCLAEEVPFFFKQWGEWTSEFPQRLNLGSREMTFAYDTTFYKVGKAKAGRMLDGREWNEIPFAS